jgi:CheY-like chemotaxis protein
MADPHVLVAADDPAIGRLIEFFIEENLGYRVTRVTTPCEAFAVARASHHPVVMVADYFPDMLTGELIPLFAEYVSDLLPLAWVIHVPWVEPPATAATFFAEREAELLWTPFRSEEFTAAVARAARYLSNTGS